MKLLKTLSFSFLLSSMALNQNMNAGNNTGFMKYNGYPAKTIVIKHPAADNHSAFFAGSQVYTFEVYKIGSAEEINKIIASFLKDKSVETCTQGNVTGDYTAITLTLKSSKDKAWFISQFKKVGLNTIKINQGEVISVDKL